MTATVAADALWRFGVLAGSSFRGLFLWFTPFPYASNLFVAPFVEIGVFAFVTSYTLGRMPTDATLAGMSVLGLSWIIFGGILQSFTYERDFGTIPVHIISRGSRAVSYLSRGALHYLDGLLAAALTLLATVIAFGIDPRGFAVGTIVLAVSAGAAACTAFALFGGNFTLIFRNWFILIGGSQGSMLALTGVIIPRTALPYPLQVVGEVIPLTHALTAMRAGFDGAGLLAVWVDIAKELAVAAGYALAGLGMYRWIEYRARVNGEFHE